MWHTGWRDEIWRRLEAGERWDVLVIGGGITGAGILREAARLGLRTLLVEKNDFAWGTSSRSSKLVHGGLRYLRSFQIGLTRASVKERERLLEEGPGLIDPLGFLLATYKGDRPPGWVFEAGLTVYDLLALRWSHQQYDAHDFQLLAPHIATEGLQGGFRYGDAQTDDARLVLRIIREAARDGGVALNYVSAESLLWDGDGQVNGAVLRDTAPPALRASPPQAGGTEGGRTVKVRARVVINATGAWADRLREQVGGKARIRPLRGSHLIFPAWKLPVAQAISFLHPCDRRPVFIFPWEGITLVGTTDVDHEHPLDEEPGISSAEFLYLMEAVNAQFAPLNLTEEDVLATFAGVRPVVGTGKADPSKESRDHVLWEERGLLTVTGGKLTTFRLIALDALKAAREQLPDTPKTATASRAKRRTDKKQPVLDPVDVDLPGTETLGDGTRRRLLGRYGADAPALVASAAEGELEPIPGTGSLWAELRWAARAEGVVHLDDLLLRRVRLGLLTAKGGWAIMGRIRAIVQPELGWDDARWEAEASRYAELWRNYYSVPERLPDAVRSEPRLKELPTLHDPRREGAKPSWCLYLGLALILTLVLGLLLKRRGRSGSE
jgi:glycerol-3-phosphate dehydrogenase